MGHKDISLHDCGSPCVFANKPRKPRKPRGRRQRVTINIHCVGGSETHVVVCALFEGVRVKVVINIAYLGLFPPLFFLQPPPQTLCELM